MSFNVPPIGRPEPVQPPPPAARTGKVAPVAGASEAVSLDAIPSVPPAELYAEMATASRRVDQLREQGRELHFSYNEAENRVQIQVRDLEGHVIREIPPSKALEIMGGAPVEVE